MDVWWTIIGSFEYFSDCQQLLSLKHMDYQPFNHICFMFLLCIGSFVILAAQIRKPLDHHRPMYGKLGALRRWRRGYVSCSCIFDAVQKVACQKCAGSWRWKWYELRCVKAWNMSILFGNHLWTLAFHALFVTEFRALGGLNRSSEGSNRFSQISKYHKYHIQTHSVPMLLFPSSCHLADCFKIAWCLTHLDQ